MCWVWHGQIRSGREKKCRQRERGERKRESARRGRAPAPRGARAGGKRKSSGGASGAQSLPIVQGLGSARTLPPPPPADRIPPSLAVHQCGPSSLCLSPSSRLGLRLSCAANGSEPFEKEPVAQMDKKWRRRREKPGEKREGNVRVSEALVGEKPAEILVLHQWRVGLLSACSSSVSIQ